MAENIIPQKDSILSSLNAAKSMRSQDAAVNTATQAGPLFSAEYKKHIEASKHAPFKQTHRVGMEDSKTTDKKATQTNAPDSRSEKTDIKQTKDGKKLPQQSKTKTHDHDEDVPASHSNSKVKQSESSKQQTQDDKDSKKTDKKDKAEGDVKASSDTTASEVAQTVAHTSNELNKDESKHKTSDKGDKKVKTGDVEQTNKSVVVDAHAVSHAKTQQVTMHGVVHSHDTKSEQTGKQLRSDSKSKLSLAGHDAKSQKMTLDAESKRKANKTGTKSGQGHEEASAAVSSGATSTHADTSNTPAVKQTDTKHGHSKLAQHLRQLHSSHTGAILPQQRASTQNVAHQPVINTGDDPKKVAQQNANKTGKTNHTGTGLRPDILHAISKQHSHKANDAGTVMKTVQKLIAEGVSQSNTVSKAIAPQANADTSNANTFNATLFNAAGGQSQLASVNGGTSTQAGLQSTTTSPQTTMLNVQPNMQSAAWAKVMSSRVVWMAKEGIQRAQIKLNPANLGPVEVHLHLHNDQASVTFVAHHAATRDALEQAMPKLRDSFSDNGLALSNAEVSQQQYSGDQADQGTDQRGGMNEQIIIQDDSNEDDIISEVRNNGNNHNTSSTVGLSLYA